MDGEPGLGAGVRRGVNGGLLVALVVVQVLADGFMFR